MKGPLSKRRKLAIGLTNFAIFLLPETRRQWARALQSELAAIEEDQLALYWTMGYLIAALRERGGIMISFNSRVSRFVLIPEMALCFGPMTLLWLLLFINFENGILANTTGAFLAYFQGEAVPASQLIGLLTISIFGVTIGVLGPMGLLLAYRIIVLRRPIQNGVLKNGLIYGPILLGLSFIVAEVILKGWGSSLMELAALLFLISVLPALGALHLLYLGSQLGKQKMSA